MEIAKGGVVGCGLMGHGIAQICAQAGLAVVVKEADQDALDKGLAKIEKQLARAVEKGKLEQADADAARGRIATTTHYGELSGCDLVIEAITEDLDSKLEMWGEVDAVVKPEALFATNTSSLSVAEQAAATSRPERFLGGGCQPRFATPVSEQNPHGFKDRGIVLDEQDFGAEQTVSTRTFRLDRRGGGLAVCDCRERHLHMEDRAAADL